MSNRVNIALVDGLLALIAYHLYSLSDSEEISATSAACMILECCSIYTPSLRSMIAAFHVHGAGVHTALQLFREIHTYENSRLPDHVVIIILLDFIRSTFHNYTGTDPERGAKLKFCARIARENFDHTETTPT